MTRKCTECGENVSEDDDFCGNCGTKLKDESNEESNSENLPFYQSSSPKVVGLVIISLIIFPAIFLLASGDTTPEEDKHEIPSGDPVEVVKKYMGNIEPLYFYDMEAGYSLTAKQSADNVSEFKEQRMLNRDLDDPGTTSTAFKEYELEEKNKYNATVTLHRIEKFRGLVQSDVELEFNLIAKDGNWRIINPPNIYG